MGALISAVLALLEELLPAISSSSAVAKIIEMLVQVIPLVVKEAEDLAPMVKNIINALKDNSVVTDDQWNQLDQLETQLDTDFDAAATAAQAQDQ